MPFRMLNNAFLMSGNMFAGCCCGCRWSFQLNVLAFSAEYITILPYAQLDAGTVCYPYNSPQPPLESGTGGTAFNTTTLTGSSSLRLWGNVEEDEELYGVECYVTITAIDDICVNGVTILAGNTCNFDVEFLEASGDQSAYGGGSVLDIACGACDPERNAALKIIGLNNGFEFLASNPEFLNLNI